MGQIFVYQATLIKQLSFLKILFHLFSLYQLHWARMKSTTKRSK